jgi:hypothetical protein
VLAIPVHTIANQESPAGASSLTAEQTASLERYADGKTASDRKTT